MSQHDTLTLEPCPFCGLPGNVRGDFGLEQVACSDPTGQCPGAGVYLPAYNKDRRAESIAAWNRRAALSATQPAQAQQAGEVVTDSAGLSMLIAGALYDFAGYLTTHPDVIEVGATGLAGPMVDRLTDFAKRCNLSLGDAAVLSWQEALTTPPAPAKPAQAAQGEPAVAQGAGEVLADLKRLASVCPELNLNNYGPDDVDELNAWAIEVSQAIDTAIAASGRQS